MQPARIVPLRVAAGGPSVRLDGDVVHVDGLTVTEPALVAFIASRHESDRAELVERALRIGLLAVQDAGTALDVDFVRREFDALLKRSETMHERAAETLDTVLRTNFGDRDGRLPRTLEHFLGDRGQLNRFVAELFDEGKRDSAIGRIRTLLGSYLDGDASRLAQMLDPTRLGSPLHQFRTEVAQGFEKLNERLTAIEAAAAARGAERARSAAKGADFEDVIEQQLALVVRGTGDIVDRIGAETGDVIRSRKGDFLLTVDPQLCGGSDLRVVIEAKDRQVSGRQMREELRAAKHNRGAASALVVFTPAHAPTGVAPFDVRGTDVYCVLDPQAPDPAVLEAAVRLARLHALASLRAAQADIDPQAVVEALSGIRAELDLVRGLKMQLTSIGSAARDVSTGLDRLRERVLDRVTEAESQLRPAKDDPAA